MFSHILCPVDGSDASILALHVAARLAAEQKARLTVCSVADPVKASVMAFGNPQATAVCLETVDSEAKATAQQAVKLVSDIITAKPIALEGQAAEAILEYAKQSDCDLIVMGSHGRSGIPRAIVGSIAEGVLRHSTIPVMIIRWTKAAVKRTSEA
jgi:nucleotide-binding universal stress UspA family protein